MPYQVLARKWRPRSFDQVVGQEHVVRALVNGLDQQRLHHAFLFSGTRGVGKTTLARILAKALNCERGVSAAPCGDCGSCREIDEGRFLDLIEVDAASRTRVEDTRDLLENVQYTPTRGRFKVYLIDEVHMLSQHSFNALLKTLEEPPPHVKFLLATTDPQRLPVTVLSRCLQFTLRRLPLEQIQARLAAILEAEGVPFEERGLQRIARAADGSMRDALSLLDQGIAFGGGRIVDADLQAMLGGIDREYVYRLLDALARRDGAGLLEQVALIAEHAPDFANLLQELAAVLHQVALAHELQGVSSHAAQEAEEVACLASVIAPEDAQLFYQIAILGRRDLPLAPDERTGLEMTLLRMLAFRPIQEASKVRAEAREVAAAPPQTRVAPPDLGPAPRPEAERAAASQGQEEHPEEEWHRMVEQLGLTGMSRELARHCVLLGRRGDGVRLLLDAAHAQIRSRATEERLLAALRERFGPAARLEIELGRPPVETPAAREARQLAERREAARRVLEQDANVVALKETFAAQLLADSVEPLDDPSGS